MLQHWLLPALVNAFSSWPASDVGGCRCLWHEIPPKRHSYELAWIIYLIHMLAYESSKTNCVATIDSILARGIRVASLSIIHFQECKLAPQACVFRHRMDRLNPILLKFHCRRVKIDFDEEKKRPKPVFTPYLAKASMNNISKIR